MLFILLNKKKTLSCVKNPGNVKQLSSILRQNAYPNILKLFCVTCSAWVKSILKKEEGKNEFLKYYVCNKGKYMTRPSHFPE